MRHVLYKGRYLLVLLQLTIIAWKMAFASVSFKREEKEYRPSQHYSQFDNVMNDYFYITKREKNYIGQHYNQSLEREEKKRE